MWIPWETDSQQEQEHWYSNNESIDGIPVLASDSEDSVIFVVEKSSPSVQGPHIIMRATKSLPTFSSFCSDASSSLGTYLISNMLALCLLYKTYIFSDFLQE